MNTGIHSLEAAKYYADELDNDEPSLNASVAKLLISASPRHAWTAHCRLNPAYEEKIASKFDVGTAAHEIFLLGNDHKVHVVEADDWKTKLAREVRDRAREQGLVPLLTHQWQQVSAMLTALREQLPTLDCDPGLFQGGKAEQTLVWRDHGVLCRARLDYLHDDFTAADDLKTSASANPLVWANRTMWSIGAEIQACMTIRGIKAVTGVTPDFRFLACETKPPFAVSPVRLGPSAIAMANHKLDRALEKWKRCLDTDTWPSYPTSIVDAEPPSWAESEMWQAEELDEVAA